MPSRLTAVRDAVAARIRAVPAESLPPLLPGRPCVLTPAVVTFEPDKLADPLTVYVTREGYADGGSVTRGTDATLYRIRVLVVGPHPSWGDPPDGWLDQRLAWVEAAVWDQLTNPRQPLELADPPALAYPQTAEVVAAYDPDALRAEQLFVSDIEITYRVEE